MACTELFASQYCIEGSGARKYRGFASLKENRASCTVNYSVIVLCVPSTQQHRGSVEIGCELLVVVLQRTPRPIIRCRQGQPVSDVRSSHLDSMKNGEAEQEVDRHCANV